MIERIVFAEVFVLAGYMLKNRLIGEEISCVMMYTTTVLYLFLCFRYEEWFIFDLHYAVIPSLWTYFLLAVCGIASIISVSMRIKSCFLAWIGRNSLFIMCTHYPIIWGIRQILDKCSLNALIYQIVVAVIVILVEMLGIEIIYKIKNYIQSFNVIKRKD